jgi:hypothetical protein
MATLYWSDSSRIKYSIWVFTSSANAKIPNSNNRQIKRAWFKPCIEKNSAYSYDQPYKMARKQYFRSKFISRK